MTTKEYYDILELINSLKPSYIFHDVDRFSYLTGFYDSLNLLKIYLEDMRCKSDEK